MLEIFIIVLSSVVGCFVGNCLYGLYQAVKLKKSIFARNYFKDTDFDFFNDSNNDKSFTDINYDEIKEE